MVRYKKTIFVHVPKTGGSWVRSVLIKNGATEFSYPHDLIQHHYLKIKIIGLKPFCFIRHPLMFIYSLWRHWAGNPQCRINNSNKKMYYQWDKKAYGEILCRNIVESDINATLQNFTCNHPGFVSGLYNCFTKGCILVGKYERIKEDLLQFLYQFNGSIEYPLFIDILNSTRVNVSQGDKLLVDKKIALEFMANEEACLRYGYFYLPEVVRE